MIEVGKHYIYLDEVYIKVLEIGTNDFKCEQVSQSPNGYECGIYTVICAETPSYDDFKEITEAEYNEVKSNVK